MKISLLASCAAVLCLVCVSPHAWGKEQRHISLRSIHLASPIEGYTQFTLIGDLEGANGRAVLEVDPNECSLNPFGDREICTEITPVTRTVSMKLTRLADPMNLNRQYWVVVGSPLENLLALIVPHDPKDSYRLVYTARDGTRQVIAMEPLVYAKNGDVKSGSCSGDFGKSTCSPLARTVDGTKAEAKVIPGFVSNTYFLELLGKKPHANTWVAIKPAVYPRKPEYWRIDIHECHTGSILLPTVAPYRLFEEITRMIGTEGIELYWANGEMQRIEVRP